MKKVQSLRFLRQTCESQIRGPLSYEVVTSVGTITTDAMVYTINKDGSFTTVGTWLGLDFDDFGTWTINDDKTEVLFNIDGEILTWTIIKLKNKELKLSIIQDFIGTDVTTTIDFKGK